MNGEPIDFDARPILETEFPQELEGITELSYVYSASIRFPSGESSILVSHAFLPSRDSTGVHGQVYYPFTLTPAGLWAEGRLGSFSLKIQMDEGSLFTVPRNLGSPSSPNPWRLSGRGGSGPSPPSSTTVKTRSRWPGRTS